MIFMAKLVRLIIIDYLILRMLAVIPLAIVTIPLLGAAVIFNISQVNEIKEYKKAKEKAKKKSENS